MLKQGSLRPLFELISHLLDIEQLLVNDTMELLEVRDNFSRSVNRILNFKELGNHRSHTFVILREDGLEHREVVLGHFVSNFIEDVNEL